MVIIVASIVSAPAMKKGAIPALKVASAPLAAPVAEAVEPVPERDAVLPVPDAPVAVADAPDVEVATAESVAAAAKSSLDAYVWQFEDATCVGV